jgi:hypothetical protein
MVPCGADYSRVIEWVTAHPSRAAAMGHTDKITHPTPIGPPPTRMVNTRQAKPARTAVVVAATTWAEFPAMWGQMLR